MFVKCLLGLWWSVEVSCQEEVITGVMRPFVPKYDQGEKPPEDRPGDGGQGSSKEDFQGEPSKTNQQDQGKEHPEDINKTNKTTNKRNQPSEKVTLSKNDLPPREETSRWERLSPEERDKKRRLWKHRQELLGYYEIQPFGTPPRNEDLDV